MALLYGPVWQLIKSSQSAEVVVSEDNLATLIQGVRRTKCAENSGRGKLGLIPWARLETEKELLDPVKRVWKVRFKLSYDTRI
jgi:hypothetical protein